MSPRPAVVATVAALVTLALWWPLRGFLPDDAFIHMQYAKHLRDGHGLVFNVGERVYGTTSPVWSALLGLLGRAGLDLQVAAQGLSLLCALAASALGGRVFARFLGGAGGAATPWIAACAALAWATDAWFLRWAGSGMETSFAALCVLAGFERYTATRPWGVRPFAPALLWSLAALARPESGLLILLLTTRVALEPGTIAARARAVALALLPAALLGGVWTTWAWAYYGTPLPITLLAKSAEYAGWSGAVHIVLLMASEFAVSRPVECAALVILGPAYFAAEYAACRGREHVVPLGWLLALPTFYAVSGVPGVTRYIVPLAPLLIAYGWRLLAPHLLAWPRRSATFVAAVGVGLAAYFVVIVPQAHTFMAGVEASLVDQGRWFKANTPPGTRVAIRDIGAFAYYSDRPIVDLAGLVTPETGELMQSHTYDDIAIEMRFAAFARPEYFIDAATEPARMKADSPYGACLTLVREGRLDHRAIRKPEPAWFSAYRIDWGCVDRVRSRGPAATGGSPTSR